MSSKFNRRDFFSSIAKTLAFYSLVPNLNLLANSEALPKAEWEKYFTDEWLYCTKGKQRFYGDNKGPDPEQFIVGLNPLNKKKLIIPVPFHGHHVEYHSKNHLLATGDKWGAKVAIADAQKEKLLKIINMPKDHSFFGHLQWNPTGEMLFASAQDHKKNEGRILVYSTKNFELINNVSSEGTMPHQLKIVDGKYLFLVNQGMNTLIVFDLITFKKLKEIQLTQKGAGHFAYASDIDRMIIGGRNFSGNPDMTEAEKTVLSKTEILNIFGKEDITPFELPHGEMLSLDLTNIDGKHFAVGTLTKPKHVYFFDVDQKKLLGKIELENEPKGVTFSKKNKNVFYFNTQEKELFMGVVSNDFKVRYAKIDELGNGQHLNIF